MNYLENLITNKKIFFNFMNENYTIFQYSNLFYRDLQYAIMAYFEMKEKPIKYATADNLAKDFIDNMVDNKELVPIDHKSWKINFELGINKNIVETEGVENE
jgi:hypothetical protein